MRFRSLAFLALLTVAVATAPARGQGIHFPSGGMSSGMSAIDTVTVATTAELVAKLTAATVNTNIILAPGTYTLTSTLDFRHKTRVFLYGNGAVLTIDPTASWTNDAIIDMTASHFCGIDNLRVSCNFPDVDTGTGGEQQVGCALLTARMFDASNPPSAGLHNFHNVMLEGYFSIAAYVNYASEGNNWFGCTFANVTSLDEAFAILIAPKPPSVLGRTLNTLETLGASSMLVQTFYGCVTDRSTGGGAGLQLTNDDAVVMISSEDSRTGDLVFDGCQFSMSNHPNFDDPTVSTEFGNGVFRLINGDENILNVVIEGCRSEAPAAKWFMWAEDEGTSTAFSGFRIENSVITTGEGLFHGPQNVAMTNAVMRSVFHSQLNADYNWAYAADGTFNTGSGARVRALVDVWADAGGYYDLGASQCQYDPTTEAANNQLGTRTTANRTAWSHLWCRASSIGTRAIAPVSAAGVPQTTAILTFDALGTNNAFPGAGFSTLKFDAIRLCNEGARGVFTGVIDAAVTADAAMELSNVTMSSTKGYLMPSSGSITKVAFTYTTSAGAGGSSFQVDVMKDAAAVFSSTLVSAPGASSGEVSTIQHMGNDQFAAGDQLWLNFNEIGDGISLTNCIAWFEVVFHP